MQPTMHHLKYIVQLWLMFPATPALQCQQFKAKFRLMMKPTKKLSALTAKRRH